VTNGERGAVVDSSVAAKWRLKDEDLVEEAELLLQRYMASKIQLVAPSLIRYELASVLEKARRLGRIGGDDVEDSLRYLLGLAVHLDRDSNSLIERASVLAADLTLSTYDATYVALAEDLDVTLVTNDRRIVDRLSEHHVDVCALKDVRSLL